MFPRQQHFYADRTGHLDDGVATVTDDAFEPFTTARYTVIDFFAPWCGPCRQLAPTFDRAATQHADRLAFGRGDVDQNPRTAAALNIMSVPTVVAFDPAGREVDRIVGATSPRQLENFLSSVAPDAA
jgi:thioredoxin 1